MHVYFLVIFHCLLDKEMEIYVNLHPRGYETALSEIYRHQVIISHIKMHKRLVKALACMYPFVSKFVAL